MIFVSIVSHGHGAMVCRLVEQLLTCVEVTRILVTLNIPEFLHFPDDARIMIRHNALPKGFALNHNSAFSECGEAYFCPLNPDIQLQGNPFSELLKVFSQDKVAMVAPRVNSTIGLQEDSWRHFPTLPSLLHKIMGWGDGRYTPPKDGIPFSPDWAAGMFMLFRRAAFLEIGGFDEGFFLYYEDVDICARLWERGYLIVAVPNVAVVHDARRDSHRKVRHLWWHFSSMLRYFYKHGWRISRVSN